VERIKCTSRTRSHSSTKETICFSPLHHFSSMASIPIPRRYRTVVYIPSRKDGCILEVCLSIPTTASPQPQAHTGVIIAHPYGPLGGSYNNNVVGALLQWFESYPLQAMGDGTSLLSSPSLVSSKSTTSKSKPQSSSTGSDPKSPRDSTEESTAESASARKKSQPVSLSCVICAFNFRYVLMWFCNGDFPDLDSRC